MSKKGAVALEYLVDLIPRVIIFVGLLAALAVLFNVVVKQAATSPAEDDLNRVFEKIKQLQPYRAEKVFTTGDDYTLVLYGQEHLDLPEQCSKAACLCVTDSKGKTSCKRLTDVSKQCATSKCAASPMCFNPIDSNKVDIDSVRKPVYVCRHCTKLMITDSETLCKGHAAK